MTLSTTIRSDRDTELTVTGEVTQVGLSVDDDDLSAMETIRAEHRLWQEYEERMLDKATLFRDPCSDFFNNDK